MKMLQKASRRHLTLLAHGIAGMMAAVLLHSAGVSAQEVIKIGIGTQNTTTNTVTGGIVLRQMQLLEKH